MKEGSPRREVAHYCGLSPNISCGSKSMTISCQVAYFAAGRKLNGAHLVSAATALLAAAANRGSGLELSTFGGSANDPSLANFTSTLTIALGAARSAFGGSQHAASRFLSASSSLDVSMSGSAGCGSLRGCGSLPGCCALRICCRRCSTWSASGGDGCDCAEAARGAMAANARRPQRPNGARRRMVPTSEERARATYQRSRPAPIYRAWRGCLTATAQDRLRVGDLDLLAVAAGVDLPHPLRAP